LTSGRSEQGKLPAAKAFRLAERDKHMSEQKQASFMQELDQWTEAANARPQLTAAQDYDDSHIYDRESAVYANKKGIRAKVLESYRNGQQAQGGTRGGKRV
jgi:hypothetical protein